MPTLNLPIAGGKLAPYATKPPRIFPAAKPPFNRIAYAAAHVVADPLADRDPWLDAAIDWERTVAFRRHLWSLGLGVAEAMDTAQRGMGMDWKASLELIRRSLDAAKDFPGALIGCGVGTDHLEPGANVTIDDVIRAYEEQCAAVEKLGGRVVLMASRALVKAARSPDDYVKVYGRVLGQVKEPVIIHWLGEMFDPALDGYWGHKDHMQAMDVAVDVVAANAKRVDGVKISLLDKDKEIAMRRRLPQGVRMYTGDDFNYPELIRGDESGYSHALLGIFDAIAPAASAALAALSAASARRSTPSWSQPFRCRATSSNLPRASTRPGWCSWPISTACRTISSWSGASRARALLCTWPSCSGSRTVPACCASPTSPAVACRQCWRYMASPRLSLSCWNSCSEYP